MGPARLGKPNHDERQITLEEGGYEGGGAMIYYLQPGPFAPSIEETILRKAHELVDRTRKK